MWRLVGAAGEDFGDFDWVISTAPAEQSAALMPEPFACKADLAGARMQGCYSLMLGYASLPDTGWDAACVGGGPLAWMAMNHSKPGRPAAPSLLCQSRNDWAETHMEDDPETVRAALLEAVHELVGSATAQPGVISLHRWRFAKVETASAAPFLLDAGARLAAAGDWCGAGRVEAAFDSAEALADALAGLISQ
jgi:predicted NAD/FAD-dependent oxidoreductase